MFRVYAVEKSMGSFWLGVRKTNGTWIKTNGKLLTKLDLKMANDSSKGECIVADANSNYESKAVDCALTFAVLFF